MKYVRDDLGYWGYWMSTTRTIGLFTDTFAPNTNGVATSVKLLQHELTKLGFEVWVIAPCGDGQPLDEYRVFRLRSMKYFLDPGFRLSYDLRRMPISFDIVHTHSPLTAGLLGIMTSRRYNVPHVTTFHTDLRHYTHYVPGMSFLETSFGLVSKSLRRYYNLADVIIAPSESTALLASSCGVTSPITVIPTGIDLKGLEQAVLLSECPWPIGSRRLLAVGRLAKEKSFDIVLLAIAASRQILNVHLVIVGSGPEFHRLSNLAHSIGIASHITFAGSVPYPRIGAYYRFAEVVVGASASETQGLVAWEAQAMGIPVVAVDASGTSEVVRDGKTGFLVPPGAFEEIARRIIQLLSDAAMRSSFSKLARVQAGANLSADYASRIASIYECLLSKRS